MVERRRQRVGERRVRCSLVAGQQRPSGPRQPAAAGEPEALGLALLVDVSLAAKFFGGEGGGWAVVQVVTYVLILVGLWYQFIVFVRIRLETRRNKREAVE